MRRWLQAAFILLIHISLTVSQTKTVDAVKEESRVAYFLSHTLHNIEATSTEVSFRLEVDPAIREIKRVSALVDVTTFNSGNSNRDSHAMEVIDAIVYPEASFASTSVSQHGDSIRVAGKLTFHGITNDVTFDAASTWSQDRLEVSGGFMVSLTAFKIARPSLLLIPVSDDLRFEIRAVFKTK